MAETKDAVMSSARFAQKLYDAMGQPIPAPDKATMCVVLEEWEKSIRADERERCAKVAEEACPGRGDNDYSIGASDMATEIMEAIRSLPPAPGEG